MYNLPNIYIHCATWYKYLTKCKLEDTISTNENFVANIFVILTIIIGTLIV